MSRKKQESKVYVSETGERLIAREWCLYERTHVNEDGDSQYRVIGTVLTRERAEDYLIGLPCDYRQVRQVEE